MTDVAQLRALLAKMTQPGKWRFSTSPQPNGCPIIGSDGMMVAMLAHSVNQPEQRDEALGNAAGIVALVNAAEPMLDEIERLRAYRNGADAKGVILAAGITIAPAEPPEAMVKLAREIVFRMSGGFSFAEDDAAMRAALAALQHVVDVVNREMSPLSPNAKRILTALGAGGRDAG